MSAATASASAATASAASAAKASAATASAATASAATASAASAPMASAATASAATAPASAATASAAAAAAMIVSATTAECTIETPAATVLTHPATAVTAVVTRKSTSLALINSRSVRNKAELIRDYIVDRDLDIVCITEKWLSTSDTAVINALTPEGYNFRNLPRTDRRGGVVGVLYKPSFHLCSSTALPATTFEGLEVVLRVGKAESDVRIVTVYRPPSTGRKSVPFQTFFEEFSIVLERCATHQIAYVILGVFNMHYGDNRTCNTPNFTELLL